jgi:hypothetical protein
MYPPHRLNQDVKAEAGSEHRNPDLRNGGQPLELSIEMRQGSVGDIVVPTPSHHHRVELPDTIQGGWTFEKVVRNHPIQRQTGLLRERLTLLFAHRILWIPRLQQQQFQ